jgi:phosphate uptake regulator
MRRRIIRQGNGAYTITLPIEWVREHRLEKKGEVDVDRVESEIVLRHTQSARGKSVKIDANGLHPRTLKIAINALYAHGADEIVMDSKSDITGTIMIALGSSMGYALVEQSGQRYIIRDLNQGQYQSLDEVFKRVFQMTLLFFDAATKALEESKQESFETLKMRDVEVNKFCMYLQRAINKRSYPDAVEGRIMFTYSYIIEAMNDEIERLWRQYLQAPFKPSSDLRKIMQLVKRALELAFAIYFQFSYKHIEELYAIRDKVRIHCAEHKVAKEQQAVFHLAKINQDVADTIHLALMKRLPKGNAQA